MEEAIRALPQEMSTNKDTSAKAGSGQVHSSKSHSVDGLEVQQNGFEKGKNSSAVQLTFQRGNAQELQRGLNVPLKTRKLSCVFSTTLCSQTGNQKTRYLCEAQIGGHVEESMGRNY